jgi:hypothetical protein
VAAGENSEPFSCGRLASSQISTVKFPKYDHLICVHFDHEKRASET